MARCDAVVNAAGDLKRSSGLSARAGFATGLSPTASLPSRPATKVERPLVDLTGNGGANKLDFGCRCGGR